MRQVLELDNEDTIRSLINNGEESNVEFKREDAHNDSIEKEFIVFLNFKGANSAFWGK